MGRRFSATPGHTKFSHYFRKEREILKISYKEFNKVNSERKDVVENEHITFLTMWLLQVRIL